MKNQLLLMTVALLLVASIQAKIITPEGNQVWWGYFNESDFETADKTIGEGQAMTLMAGIYIPAKHEQLGKATIQAVRVYLPSSAVSSLSNMKVWISQTLPKSITDADIVQSTVGSMTSGANDYKLRTPYEVNNEGFYIGYSVKSTTGYFIRCGGTDAANAFWYGNPDAGVAWTDLNGDGYGKLAFQLLVEGGNFPTDCATAEDFGQNVVLQGEEASIPITITNKGQNTINYVSYTIATEGGSATDEKEVSVGSLPLNGSKTINIPFVSDPGNRKYKKTLTITQVDGKSNTASNPNATGFLITLAEKQPVTPVIEEFTGTWCGWCPRGTVGMEKVHENYGDQVVQIAIHNGDPMEVDAYNSIISAYCNGYPGSITDRQYKGDPSFSRLKNILTTAFKRNAQGCISLSAMWDGTDKRSLTFTTKTRFVYSEENGQYAIAYVLVEDGLTGTGSSWAQRNAYSGNGTGDMAWWGNQATSVPGIEYNHVAVAGWNTENGIDGSVNPVIKAGAEQVFCFSGRITGNTLIQDKTKLKAIALLIDRTTGTIVNSAQTEIQDFDPNSVPSVIVVNTQPSAFYSVDGRKLTAPRNGINIIRRSDGTTRKVLVK